MSDDPKSRIRTATGFVLPDAYDELLNVGRLQFGVSREDWSKNSKEILRNRPPALCCSPFYLSVEWFTVDNLIEHWAAPHYWDPRTLVAFAGDGYGNYWCWAPESTNECGTPVVFYDHDEGEVTTFAASFKDFLYRMLLESFARLSYDHYDELDVNEDGFREYLALHVELVSPHLDPDQVVNLRRILHNDLVGNEHDESYSLISKMELDKIVARDILGKRTSVKYRWMKSTFDDKDLADDERPTRVDIWLLREPKDGLAGLLKICKKMNLSISMSEYRGILANLPCHLCRDVTIHPHMPYVAEINATDPCTGVFEVDENDRPVIDSRWDWRHEELIKP